MKNRIPLIMTVAVVAGFIIILLMNIGSFFGLGFETATYLSQNNVRGSAAEHQGLLYTLNFDQQSRLIGIINHSVPITKAQAEQRKAEGTANQEIQKVVIYRFNAPDLEIVPQGYVNKANSAPSHAKTPAAMVYSVPVELVKEGLLEEGTPGELHQLISETYDR